MQLNTFELIFVTSIITGAAWLPMPVFYGVLFSLIGFYCYRRAILQRRRNRGD